MKYFLFILGCQYNYHDASRLAHLLNKMGYVLGSEKEADLIIVLACSVRQKGVDRIYGKVSNWNKLPQKPKIIISACILPEDKKKLSGKVKAIVDIKELIKYIYKFKIQPLDYALGRNLKLKIDSPHVFLPLGESSDTAYVPIMQGCDNFCSYCAVPYTRGKEVSRSEREILAEIKGQLGKGHKHILLLGQNVNSYGLKFQNPNSKYQINSKLKILNSKINHKSKILNHKLEGLPFANLLEKIDHIKSDFSYNFMSSNPHDFSDDLVETLAKLEKWEKVLHLPLQSGDDKILKKMNRKYTSQQYLSLIENCKLKIENLSVTTDIIVGFPTENEKQFQNTVKLCKKIGFSKAYVSQYSPRPHTLSARTMNNDVPIEERKRRWTILNNLINFDK